MQPRSAYTKRSCYH